MQTLPQISAVPSAANPGQSIDYDRFLDCIHCGLCLSVCPTYEELGTEMDGPRGRIYLMRQVTDGRLPLDAAVRTHLDLCLNCRACETACPSGVRYHEILEPFRAGLAKLGHHGKQLPWVQRLAMNHLFPFRGRSRWALAPLKLLQRVGIDKFLSKLLPRSVRSMQDTLPRLDAHYGQMPKVLPAEGKKRARVALFLGCVADAVYPQTNLATARVLQRNGCEVWIPRVQGCCGALDFHDHREERARKFALANLQAFGFLDSNQPEPDAIIINAAGCGAMLKDYPTLFRETEHAEAARKFVTKVKDVSEFLTGLGLVKPTHSINMKVAYHDACHLRHAQQVYTQPRQLLSAIPGLELIPLPESELCCGAAGSYNLTQPEMADRLGERKAERILATGCDAVAAGNVGCLLQIEKHVRQHRPNFRAYHTIDLLWKSYNGAAS